MEVRITISDGVVMAETHGRSSTGTSAASDILEMEVHPTSGGLPTGTSVVAAAGAINAGPAPVELSASQRGTPMPFITSTQQGAGARSSMEANLPADESGGTAPASVR
jgi:hypothetical protein